MKLNFITLMVMDVGKSAAFCQDVADLRIVNQISLKAGEIVFLANGKSETMLEQIGFAGAEHVTARGLVISFAANAELEEIRQKAIALGCAPSGIIDAGPKPRHFTVADPDGVTVGFNV